MRTRLFLNTLPFTLRYSSWQRCLSIFLDSLYFFKRRLNTRILFIHTTFSGILAFAVPCLLPNPLWRPFLLASRFALVLALLWTTVGFLMMRPSLISFLTLFLEFALLISFVSFGSSQIFPFPHFSTLAAKPF